MAVVYHVDHGTSSIYMERVEGHSLKTLLHGGHLGGTGEQEGQQRCSARLSAAQFLGRHGGACWCTAGMTPGLVVCAA